MKRFESVFIIFLQAQFVCVLGMIGLFFWASIVTAEPLDSEILRLQNQILLRQKDIDTIQKQKEENLALAERKRQAAVSLKNEIGLLESSVAESELEIERLTLALDKTLLESEELERKIVLTEGEIDQGKKRIGELLLVLQRYNSQNQLHVLILKDSLSEFLKEVRYVRDLQDTVHASVQDISDAKRLLLVDRAAYDDKKSVVQDLRILQEQERSELLGEQNVKSSLLEQTKNSEREFQNIVVALRSEQREINEELQLIEQNVRLKLEQQKLLKNLDIDPEKLLWPITNQGIVARFHDPEYPFIRLIGQHSGIDLRTLTNGIPTPGMPIRAAASGIVIKVIDNGRYTGNAAFISHGELMTIYLHMSKLMVREDDVVAIGDTIGLSGGMPGAYGSGLSLGPHLHFEVRLNGLPVDPCDYLQPSC